MRDIETDPDQADDGMWSLEQTLTILGESTKLNPPYRFALYGVDLNSKPFLGWGLDFRGQAGACFYNAHRQTMTSDTCAEAIRDTLDIHNVVELRWHDPLPH